MKMAKIPGKKKVWIDEYTIPSYEVDPRGKATLPALCRFLQETAYHHAHNLELGYEHLKQKKQFWVLSRLLVKITAYPAWDDRIEVHTWPSGVERLFALRDFKIQNKKGELLGAAASAWLILDSERHRPQRPGHLEEEIGHLVGEPAFEQRPEKIAALPNPQKGRVFPVRYSDLDLYDHVNNVKYIRWILDSYPIEMHREHEIATFAINFLSEAKYGDDISICTGRPAAEASLPQFGHSVKREADNRDVCVARVEWTPLRK